MYSYERINHTIVLTHAVLAGLTPLIPIPFLDDWVKAIFLRRMVRQITLARGINLPNEVVDTLLQEDFWNNCLDGCLGITFRLLRELFSKVFFWIEWRRALNTVSITYYTGFLLDAALLDGYPLAAPVALPVTNPDAAAGSPNVAGTPPTAASLDALAYQINAATLLREAIRRARYGANLKLIQRLIRPRELLSAAWTLTRRSLAQLPRMLVAVLVALWQGMRAAPGAVLRGVIGFPRRARDAFYLRVQVLLGREKAPELLAVERLVHSMQESLLKIDPAYFDSLRVRLIEEINRPAQT